MQWHHDTNNDIKNPRSQNLSWLNRQRSRGKQIHKSSDNGNTVFTDKNTIRCAKTHTLTAHSDWFFNSNTNCRISPAYALLGSEWMTPSSFGKLWHCKRTQLREKKIDMVYVVKYKGSKRRVGEFTLTTANFRFILSGRLAFCLRFPLILTGLVSNLWKPTTKPDNFHFTPIICKTPSTLGVTVSCTWN